ncbi:MAG: hypothetical protein KUG74_04790 [Rhodobacteraceae bacterium]|nr:hypothetical protein [Paracoccaceae bacterium]
MLDTAGWPGTGLLAQTLAAELLPLEVGPFAALAAGPRVGGVLRLTDVAPDPLVHIC